MKTALRQLTVLFLAIAFMAMAQPVLSAAQQAVGGTSQNHVAEFVPGEILVQTANDIRFLEMYGVNPYVSVRKLERFRDTVAPRVATPGGVTLQAEADDYVVSLPPYMDVQLALDIIGQDPRVTAVSPNFYRMLVPNIPVEDKFFGPPSISAPPVDNQLPNDPRFSEQGQFAHGGWPGIGPTTFSDGKTYLAIIDGGPPSHPDFAEERFDIRSFNILTNNNQIHQGDGHGLNTLGVAAEDTNNSAFGAGLYGGKVLMLVVIKTDTGKGTLADLVEAINRAIPIMQEIGVGVINISLGGVGFSQIELDAIKRAAAANILVVAAAGNEATQNPIYPAGLTRYSGNVISVGASDSNDNVPAFSNFGDSVTISALGIGVGTMDDPAFGGFSFGGGTSVSAPQVSGAAALIFQQVDGNGNHPTWQRVKDAIIGGGDPLPNPNVRVGETSVRATLTGKRLNIRRALSGQLDPAVLPVADLKVSATRVGQNITVTLDASGSFSPTGRRLVSYVFFPGGEKDTEAGIISLSPIISVSYSASALGQKLPSVRVVDEDGMFSVANGLAVAVTDTVAILSATLKKGTLKVKATFSDPSSSPASLVVVTADGTLLTPVGGWSRNKKGIFKFLGSVQLPTCGCTTSLRVRLTSTGGGVAEAPL